MSDQSDLTAEDKTILAELLRETIAADYRFPMSPRMQNLRAILYKLEQGTAPPLKPPGEAEQAARPKLRGGSKR
jgi:hypothetical protein